MLTQQVPRKVRGRIASDDGDVVAGTVLQQPQRRKDRGRIAEGFAEGFAEGLSTVRCGLFGQFFLNKASFNQNVPRQCHDTDKHGMP